MRLQADRDARTLSGVMLPYGETGFTSAGRVVAERGTVTVPEPCTRVKLFLAHDAPDSPRVPVGVLIASDDTDDGLTGVFRIARGALGDQLIADAEDDVRDGLSVELDAVDIRDGRLVAGELLAVAAVPIPAWSTARIAAEHTATPGTPEGWTVPDTLTAAPAELVAEHDPIPTPSPPPAGAAVRAAARTRPVSPLVDLTRRLAAAYRTHDAGTLMAALADITPATSDAGLAIQALGELWAGIGYTPRYSSLIASGSLTGVEVRSFRWNPAPTVADYAGNKAEVPSNAAVLEAVSTTPTRLAGAHDIDRIYRDLGDDAVLRSYWARMAESYAVQLDARALAAIKAADTSAGTAANLAIALVQASASVSNVATPTFAIVADDLVIEAAGLPSDTAPVGLLPGSLVQVPIPPITVAPAASVGARNVIVGARAAVRQLTFEPPVRLEAVNVPNAGIDAGLYGYSAELVENAAAVSRQVVSALPGP